MNPDHWSDQNITPSPNLTVAPQEHPSQPQSSQKSNRLVVVLSILSIIFFITTVVFIYLYFTKPDSQAQTQNQDQTQNQAKTQDLPQAETTTSAESELTDANIIQDLDEKIAILHDTSQLDATIDKGTVGGYSINFLNMYTTGYLDPLSMRVAYVINSIETQFHDLNSAEREAVINNIQAEYREGVEDLALQGINGDIVAEKYRDVFGKELSRETSTEPCYTYRYNETYDFYYQDPVGGCGGTSPYRTYHYKNKYTIDGDKAYVYIYTALLDDENGNVYCDVAYLYTSGVFRLSDDAKICANSSGSESFTLDESNYQDFVQYRFVFNRADDNTYYFDKVEKPSV